jgi:hypothetical protein
MYLEEKVLLTPERLTAWHWMVEVRAGVPGMAAYQEELLKVARHVGTRRHKVEAMQQVSELAS